MLNKNKKNEQGFTFVEILTCLAIVALIVGPICFSFLSSLKTRVTAESISEATTNAEKLLEDIKVQMTDDIVLRQKFTGNRIATASYAGASASVARDGVGEYLVDLPDASASRSTVAMTSFFKGTTSAELNTRYNTDDYAYEVALWKMNDVPLVATGSVNTLVLDENAIGKATKLYTDSNTDYQFKASKYTGLANPITFKLSDQMLKAFADDELMYVPNLSSTEAEYKILDKNVVTIAAAGGTCTAVNTKGNIKIDSIKPIKNSSDVVQGYVFKIAEGSIDTSKYPKAASYYRSIIELDVRNVLRNATDLSNNTTYDKLTFKFENTTNYDQLIYIRQNALDSTEALAVNQKFNVVATNSGLGKSSIIRTDDICPYENYVIAIIVREKSPALGEPGKIVKKSIDIFSYDVTTDQRR